MSEWSTTWNNPTPADPRDTMDRDQLLMEWMKLKEALALAKELEMDMRKYVTKRAFPEPVEGVNTQELGNGYQLKAKVKYNYKLDSDNNKIWDCLDRISKIGNEGPFIAERLVSWTPSFLLTEYRTLQESDSETAKSILKEIETVLVITDAAPELKIKEPKKKNGK